MKGDVWDIDDNILHMFHVREPIVHLSLQRTGENLEPDSLQHCLIEIAHLVNKHGDDYIPIFERIKSEIENDYEKQQTKLLISEITSKCLLHPSLTVV